MGEAEGNVGQEAERESGSDTPDKWGLKDGACKTRRPRRGGGGQREASLTCQKNTLGEFSHEFSHSALPPRAQIRDTTSHANI